MTSSTIPVRVGPLALLLRERAVSDALEAYAHDIQWSILCSIHSMCGSKCSAPSYSSMVSSMVERVRGRGDRKKPEKDVVQEVNDSVQAMIDMFLPGKRGEKSETI